jgi:hypothetical protein
VGRRIMAALIVLQRISADDSMAAAVSDHPTEDRPAQLTPLEPLPTLVGVVASGMQAAQC